MDFIDRYTTAATTSILNYLKRKKLHNLEESQKEEEHLEKSRMVLRDF